MIPKKTIAMAIVAMFIAGAFIVTSDSESDAISAGTMNIYIYDGEDVTEYTNLSGYNALQALMSIEGITVSFATHDNFLSSDYVIQKTNEWGSYDEINEFYGDIESIDEIVEADNNKWNTFYYTGSTWVSGTDAIGFITPFTDGAIASANVALCYGEAGMEIPSEISDLESLADMIVPSGNDYQYTFYLKVDASGYNPVITDGTTVSYLSDGVWTTGSLTSDLVCNGVTVRGHGSNAYAALKDALGSNVTGTDTAGPYYGWLGSLFGLTTVNGDVYTYWTQNTAADQYLSFNLGAYSSLSNVPNDGYTMQESAFKLIYTAYSFS